MDNVIRKERVIHPLFGEIERIVTEDGKNWYEGKNIASALGYKSPNYAIKNLKDILKVKEEYRTGLGYTAQRPYTYIGKEGVKTLIVKCTICDIKKRVQEALCQIALI